MYTKATPTAVICSNKSTAARGFRWVGPRIPKFFEKREKSPKKDMFSFSESHSYPSRHCSLRSIEALVGHLAHARDRGCVGELGVSEAKKLDFEILGNALFDIFGSEPKSCTALQAR